MQVFGGKGLLAVLLLLQQCLTSSRMMANAWPARNDSSVNLILWPAQSPTRDSVDFGASPDNNEVRALPIEAIGKAAGNGISYVGNLWDAGMQLGLEVARRIFTGLQVG